MHHLGRRRSRMNARANDFSVLNPTIWAQEALAELLPNMILGNLVNRAVDGNPRKLGDVVNVLVPPTFEMTRKCAPCDDVVVQDASAGSIQIPLDQWPQVSFLICDGDEDRNQLDLIDLLLKPAVTALSKGVDRIVSAQVHQFVENGVGHLGQMTADNFYPYLLEAGEKMSRLNVPEDGRTMIITPGTRTKGLTNKDLVTADKRGDGGTALERARLGNLAGFDIVMSQTIPEIVANQTTITADVDNAGGYAVGATEIAFDNEGGGGSGGGGTIAVGQWAVIEGDETPQHVTAVGSGTMTIWPGLKYAVDDDAAITIIEPGAVNLSGGYAGPTTAPTRPGYCKQILIDGLPASPPQVGQLVSFGTSDVMYGIIRVDVIDNAAGEYGIWLDKPLAASIANNASVNLGPAGDYNFGIVPGAFTLLVASLPAPRVGALSRVIVDRVNRIAIRVTITYDGKQQGHLVTLDLLVGVGVARSEFGVPMYG